MRILAIETATEACSVALFEDGELLDSRHEILGRGHAERLVPLISELPERGRADLIRVSLGPGSFTGTRIGLAAARALAIAWGAKVEGFPTLALVASCARAQANGIPIDVAMAGGHGEIYVQSFDPAGLPTTDHTSLPLAKAAEVLRANVVAGNRSGNIVEERGFGDAIDLLPDAMHALEVPHALLTDRLSPLYGRPPDAKLPGT